MNRQLYLNWLTMGCWLTIAFGVVSVLGSFAGGAGAWLYLFDILFWPIDGAPTGFDQVGYTLNAVLGGVMVGWGVLMLQLTRGPITQGNGHIAYMMLISIISWFVVDSIGSFLAGTYLNIALNVTFLIVFVPPCLALRQSQIATS